MKEHTLDTNVTCYVANGVWHHYLCTGDTGFLEAMFPVVERAIDFALDNQHPTGEIEWDADPARVDGKGALLTGSSSIYSSLRCAIAGRRTARPRTSRLGAVARFARDRDRAPARALPRQGTLGDNHGIGAVEIGAGLTGPGRIGAIPRGAGPTCATST